MKIAILTYQFNLGGAGIAAEQQYYAFKSAGYDVYKIDLSEKLRAHRDFSRRLSVKLGNLVGRWLSGEIFSFDYFAKSQNLAFLNEYDVLIIHWPHFATLNFDDLVHITSRKIFVAHDMFFCNFFAHYVSFDNLPSIGIKRLLCKFLERVLRRRRKRVYSYFDLVVSPSEWLCGELGSAGLPIPAVQIDNFFNQSNDIIDMSLQARCDIYKIAFGAATLQKNSRKGLDLFLEVLQVLREKLSNHEVLIFGAGEISEAIKQNQNIHFTGELSQKEVREALHDCDLYVHTARMDNAPNIIIESLMVGTPVCAFAVGGVTELIENNSDGVLIEPYEISEMAKVISELASDKLKLQSKTEILQNAVKKFSSEPALEKWKMILSYE